MAEWRAHIQGDEFDLEELAARVVSLRYRIRREEGRYFLTGDRLNSLATADEVRATANEILKSLNGIARLRFNAKNKLTLGNLERVEDDGLTHRFLSAESATYDIRERAAVVSVGGHETGEPCQPADPSSLWFDLAGSDEIVARVLVMYGEAVQPWKDLYPIFEIIESDAGGTAALTSRGWTSKNQIERFTRTANHSDFADARHGASTVDPPAKPMSPNEARAFIKGLLTSWLEFKLKQRVA